MTCTYLVWELHWHLSVTEKQEREYIIKTIINTDSELCVSDSNDIKVQYTCIISLSYHNELELFATHQNF